MNISILNKVPSGTKHFCHLIGTSSTEALPTELAFFKSHLNEKRKEKKNSLIRLIDKQNHFVVALIHHDKSKSESDKNEDLRKLGFQLANKFNAEKAKEIVIVNGKNVLAAADYVHLLEGMLFFNYNFNKYKSKKDERTIKKIGLFKNAPSVSEVKEISNIVASTNVARDLINEPVITLNSIQLGKEITQLSKKAGFTVKILNKAQIEKLKMGGLLGVNRGSVDPPIFAILEWKPAKAKNKKPYILVGKGVVYDTGGYNIKTGPNMATMKCDMGGAAAVIGTFNAVSLNKLPIHMVGLIPITDNRIGGNALVADDIIKMYDGTTVEVLNTDAEGRLILGDALAYAKKYNPELVIDLATLTGAAAAITGSLGSAIMGTADEKTKVSLKQSGDHVYERVAEMPFWREYEDMLKSNVADLKNIGGPVGGAMTAGKFLQYFTKYPWIHIDIAGPAFIDKSDHYRSAGGTGVGVRLLYHFFKNVK